MSKRFVFRCLIFAFLALSPTTVLAQSAWIPPRGEVNFSTTYQWVASDRHVFSDAVLGIDRTPLEELQGRDFQSKERASGKIQSHGVLLDGDIALTNRFALMGGVAITAARYLGERPESAIDDGAFHSSFQDARIGARYMVDRELWAITPFATFLFPITDYEVVGHASPGRRLKELQLGASVGRILMIAGAPRAYVEGSYSYAVTENPNDEMPLDRSRGRIEFGFFHGRFSAQAMTNWQRVHGGFEWSDIGAHNLDDVFHEHDRAAATREWQFGGGVSFEIGDSTAIYASYNDLLWGENTHNASALTFGMNWAFQAFGGLRIGPFGD